jgi:hypothetical protein
MAALCLQREGARCEIKRTSAQKWTTIDHYVSAKIPHFTDSRAQKVPQCAFKHIGTKASLDMSIWSMEARVQGQSTSS